MKIVAAPNAFKGSLTALDAANAMKKGIQKAVPEVEVVTVPVADGGDGFTEVITDALQGQLLTATVNGPLMDKQAASFGYAHESGVAIIEMAQASGLVLIPDNSRNPLITTTYGTGELIRAALDNGASTIIIGLGGSATCDGGIGMAAALGYTFFDKDGAELPPIGQSLPHISTISSSDVDERLPGVTFRAVCDVTNPLFGPNGASHIYSPQKGATQEQVLELDKGLQNLAKIIQHDLGHDISDTPGSGAAGGLGAGLSCFVGASLEKGIDIVLDLIGLHKKLHGADLVITGEGQIDFQTKFDKAPAGVAKLAQKMEIPCIAICGSVGERVEELHEIGINSIFSLCRKPLTLEYAMENSFQLLADETEQVVRTFCAAK